MASMVMNALAAMERVLMDVMTSEVGTAAQPRWLEWRPTLKAWLR